MGLIKTLEANCRDCYKCVRSCPVKAIKVFNGHSEVDEKRCVLCGRCVPICPQNARTVYEQTNFVKKALTKGQKVTVSLSPSFPAFLDNTSVSDYIALLKRAGFTRIVETAEAANVLFNEKKLIRTKKPFISSYCPAVVSLVEKYYPDLTDYLAPLVSPLVAHARYLKRNFPDEFLVFILPCDAKKAEALSEPEIDAALTFNELDTVLKHYKTSYEDKELHFIESEATFASRTLGLSGSLSSRLGYLGNLDSRAEVVSGFEECIAFLEDMKQQRIGLETEFIEMLLCSGGCVNGSGIINSLSHKEKKEKMLRFAEQITSENNVTINANSKTIPLTSEDIRREFTEHPVVDNEPSEEEIQVILASMGKRTSKDELDCGACGYETCREKAKAVYRGFAEIEMCIPYMRAKAETMNDVIIQATPNGIIVVDEDLNIITINPAAERMFQCKEEVLKGRKVSTLIDTEIFDEVFKQKRLLVDNVEFPSYGLKVRHFVFYVPKSRVIIAIFADITEQTRQKDQLSELRKETLERAQEVMNKQMRVAQEIASLLGETTAETKVTLDQLMRIIKG